MKYTHLKRDICIITVLVFTTSVSSHALSAWTYLYDNGKFVDVQGTMKLLIWDQYGPPRPITVQIPPEWIHMAWTPTYLFEKAIRSETNQYLAPYGNVPNMMVTISNLAFVASFMLSALQSIRTFSHLFDNRWFFVPSSLNFKSMKPF